MGRPQGMTAELGHHGVVGKLRVGQTGEVVAVEDDEIAGLDDRQITARGLDEERGSRFPERIGERALARGIAAAMHGQIRLGAEQARDVDELGELPAVLVGPAQRGGVGL